MNQSESSRRTFLKTAALTGGVLAGTGLVPGLSPLGWLLLALLLGGPGAWFLRREQLQV